METQLLILKNGTDYIRITGEEYSACGLDKASVFILSKLSTVKEHQKKLQQAGYSDAEIYKLLLTETPFYSKESLDDTP